MANFMTTTVSSGSRIKKEKRKKVYCSQCKVKDISCAKVVVTKKLSKDYKTFSELLKDEAICIDCFMKEKPHMATAMNTMPRKRGKNTKDKKQDQQKPVIEMWEEFGNVPVNNDNEIEQDFYHFEKGTDRDEVWHWFEEIDPTFSVGEMINN